jgi:predicted signal transduction protein with EAL and GGDEF domain
MTEGGGLITPEQYIPVAERAGLVAAIDNLLLVAGSYLVITRKILTQSKVL